METKTCVNDAILTLNENYLIIERKKGFISLGTSAIGGDLGLVRSLITLSLITPNDQTPEDVSEVPENLTKILAEKDVLKPLAVISGHYDILESINMTHNQVTVIITPDNLINHSVSITVLINEKLDKTTLIELFKTAVINKTNSLWDRSIINSLEIDNDLGCTDNVIVACTGKEQSNYAEIDELRLLVGKLVREAMHNLLEKQGYPKDILGYMKDVGVTIDELVDAGMELCVGVDKSEELDEKLRKQLLKSLEDLNVVSLIMAGIRLEEDYARQRIRGIDVSDDPAYLYSDEVLGMAVANQIAGTKAIFNFKRYDETKPGVIGTLGPILDDIFAGLIAGCMSKIFEE